MRRPSQPLWYTLLAVVVSVLVTAAAALVIADRAARESERRWCDVITTMDEAYRVAPPQTEIGQRLARDLAALREDFDCP
ncbi:hypothetical protein GCM10027280_45240 [Micromonospora polyrhachis]|uniref:Uncharacterized protein n=1 Tax=Micromonospora polyrhachis TaxID=1282883 RepID=A0A7W7SRJ3_9ACTN|nr:hypothetical protein [Micromonospora polyrhachis]MBB4958962.1 hypothetical protein [Micromonospora polyrhachis]